MEIVYFGHAMFKLTSKDCVLVTDPPAAEFGIKTRDTTADIVTVSHAHYDHNAVDIIGGSPKVFDTPGEFEAKGAAITGIPTYHDKTNGSERGSNTVFVIQQEGIKVAHLGDIGHALTDEQLSQIGDVDILFVPVGGFYTIDAEVAAKIVSDIEPKIVIPMHYKSKHYKTQADAEIAPVEKFLKVMGIETPKTTNKLKIVQKELPTEEMEVILLEPSL